MSHYAKHVFFCLNRRDDGRDCCAAKDAESMQAHAKQRVRELGLDGPGKVRVNKAGCLDRCDEGPCVVIYPEGVWYTYVDRSDIDEIVDEHLVGDRIVQRLQI